MNNLVSAKWLKDNINDKNIVIVDCRFNLMDKEYGKKSYEKGHIKGAKRVDIETELSSIVKKHGGRHPLPSVKELKNTFENIGMCIGLMPVTGIPLPFISYGGTAMVTNMLAIGLVLSVSRNNKPRSVFEVY